MTTVELMASMVPRKMQFIWDSPIRSPNRYPTTSTPLIFTRAVTMAVLPTLSSLWKSNSRPM